MAIWITAFLLLASILSGAEAGLQPPGNLHFTSNNGKNIFHWNPAQRHSQIIRYDVQYLRYGQVETFIPVKHCTGIPHHHCDLTQETWDFKVEIIARVRSVIGNITSEWERSENFNPLEYIPLGFPSFNIKAECNMIRVNISPPTLQTGGRNLSMEELLGKPFLYIVYLRENSTDKAPEEVVSSGELNKTTVLPGKTYCVSVRAVLNGDTKEGNATEEKCATIPITDPVLDTSIFGVISAVFLIFSLSLCLGMACWLYLKKQSTIPAVLKSLDKNKKCLSLMDYLSLIEDVVVQQVFADSTLIGPCKIQEQDDLWSELKIREASSVDSGIDIGSGSSGPTPSFCEPLNPYMQQTPESSSQRSVSPEGDQNNSQPKESCLINIPDTINAAADTEESIMSSGYQRQTPRTNAASEQEECTDPAQTAHNMHPCSIPTLDVNITEGFSKGFLSLDDVLLTDNGM
ncbi:interleukin-20 receptor subunit alpha-like [Scyliorhinus canicula]|uniref:interleukin-20 receptor subunit alpha-like n=1 Tax=Scyliorhinus canicula TaxID=7830 RepID=UPI0018F2A60E|nr:interleukin-20 receptor subunit alpha-like [Scyliorhinus canicula]